MLPLVARNLLESIALLSQREPCAGRPSIGGFKRQRGAHERRARAQPGARHRAEPDDRLCKAAEIAKRAYREGRPIVDVADEMTELGRERLIELLDPAR